MTGETLFIAMGYIDDELVDEALRVSGRAQRRRARARAGLRTALIAAALLALLTGAALAVSPGLRALLPVKSPTGGEQTRIELVPSGEREAPTPGEMLSTDYVFPETPEGYEVDDWWKSHIAAWIEYRGGGGEFIKVSFVSAYGTNGTVGAGGTVYLRTEGAELVEELEINGSPATVVVRDGVTTVLVADTEMGVYIALEASALTPEEAEALIAQAGIVRQTKS